MVISYQYIHGHLMVNQQWFIGIFYYRDVTFDIVILLVNFIHVTDQAMVITYG